MCVCFPFIDNVEINDTINLYLTNKLNGFKKKTKKLN